MTRRFFLYDDIRYIIMDMLTASEVATLLSVFDISEPRANIYLNPIRDMGAIGKHVSEDIKAGRSAFMIGKDVKHLLQRIQQPLAYWGSQRCVPQLHIWLAVLDDDGYVTWRYPHLRRPLLHHYNESGEDAFPSGEKIHWHHGRSTDPHDTDIDLFSCTGYKVQGYPSIDRPTGLDITGVNVYKPDLAGMLLEFNKLWFPRLLYIDLTHDPHTCKSGTYARPMDVLPDVPDITVVWHRRESLPNTIIMRVPTLRGLKF